MFVAIYSVIFLKHKIYRHQVTGILLLFLGLSIVTASHIINQAASSDDPILGGIILIVSQKPLPSPPRKPTPPHPLPHTCFHPFSNSKIPQTHGYGNTIQGHTLWRKK